MPISDRVYQIMMTLGGVLAGVGGIIAMPQWEVLGVPRDEAGAVVAIAGALVILIASAIRANFPHAPVAPPRDEFAPPPDELA